MGIKKYFNMLCVFLAIGLLLGTAAAASDAGNRIWDENANQSLTYIWTPQTYSGFYYDLDTGEGSENLTVQDSLIRSVSCAVFSASSDCATEAIKDNSLSI